MKINMAGWDRTLRLLVGVLLLTWAIAGGPWWAYFGLAILATAAFRFCPLYSFFRTGTVRPTLSRFKTLRD